MQRASTAFTDEHAFFARGRRLAALADAGKPIPETKGIVALDADGVLLDYNLAYARAWERAFGVYPLEKDPHTYWAIDRWQVERPAADRLQQFRSCFDESFWSGIPAIEGVVQACQHSRGLATSWYACQHCPRGSGQPPTDSVAPRVRLALAIPFSRFERLTI